MLIGSLLMAPTSWTCQIAGRLVAGAGGVLLNVQLTKMVPTWFAGQEIATAMAIFVNSWPAGIARPLLMLPIHRHRLRRKRVHLAVAALIACGIVLLATLYRPPPDVAVMPTTRLRLTAMPRPP